MAIRILIIMDTFSNDNANPLVSDTSPKTTRMQHLYWIIYLFINIKSVEHALGSFCHSNTVVVFTVCTIKNLTSALSSSSATFLSPMTCFL